MCRAGISACVIAYAGCFAHGIAQAQRGTHYLAELEGGVTPANTPGFAGSLLFGGGGKPRGTPLRIYALAEMSFAEEMPAIALRAPTVRSDQRRYFGLAAGARLYVPIAGELRLFLDALGGASYNTAELGTAAVHLDESDWYIQGALAGGLQYRLLRELSLGLRVKWVASDDPLSDVREQLGLSNAFPWSTAASVTWHF